MLKNKAQIGYFIIITYLLLIGVAIIPLFMMTDTAFSTWNIVILFFIIFSFPYFLKPYLDEMRMYKNRHISNSEAVYVGQGRFMKSNHEAGYLIYNRTTPCIYPCCEGKIVIVDAPPREILRLGKKFVGICSIAGKDHSYRIDHIGVAFSEQLDWRDLNKKYIEKF